jgi:hypothetical protein
MCGRSATAKYDQKCETEKARDTPVSVARSQHRHRPISANCKMPFQRKSFPRAQNSYSNEHSFNRKFSRSIARSSGSLTNESESERLREVRQTRVGMPPAKLKLSNTAQSEKSRRYLNKSNNWLPHFACSLPLTQVFSRCNRWHQSSRKRAHENCLVPAGGQLIRKKLGFRPTVARAWNDYRSSTRNGNAERQLE